MRITKNVFAAEEDLSTKYYRITREAVMNAYNKYDDFNIVFKEAFKTFGWKIFAISQLWGSRVIDDVLYYCDSEGEPVIVNGIEYQPDQALDSVNIEDLENYIYEADDDFILDNLTDYELQDLDMIVEGSNRSVLDQVVIDLLTDEDYHEFKEIVKACRKLDLI